ncbi:MAG: metallophosphoesterase [Candidatus Hydrogenedentes bacterium]|nr:metallophosphoesterase [Candidatus Hydrogenedentota bacterium]
MVAVGTQADMKHNPDQLNAEERRRALWERRVALEPIREERSRRRDECQKGLRYWVRPSHLLEPMLRAFHLFDRGRRNATHPTIRRVSFAFDALPAALDGFRLLHLSDLHFRSGDPAFAETLRDFVAGVDADLCVLTGDYCFEYHGPYEHVIEQMSAFMAGVHTRLGTVAIFGNHDHSTFLEPLTDMGIRVLVNDSLAVTVNGARLRLVGVDDPHFFRCDDLAAAMDGAGEDDFVVMLIHSPERFAEAAEAGGHLYLCGHTHWGQVRLPVLGAVFVNARCPRRYCFGPWRYRGMQGYTSAGLGTTDVPVRFNCPPSGALIELKRRDTT